MNLKGDGKNSISGHLCVPEERLPDEDARSEY